MANTDPPSSHHVVDEDSQDKEPLALVLELQPPAPASACNRAAWRMRNATAADDVRPSWAISVVTTSTHTATDPGVETNSMEPTSPGFPSPNQSSSPEPLTPTDLPDASHLPPNKDEAPDTHYSIDRYRMPNRDGSGPSVKAAGRKGYAAAEVTSLPQKSTAPLLSQGYTVCIDILQEEGNYDSRDSYWLLVDLASDDTFVLGDGLLQLHDTDKDSQRNTKMKERFGWSAEDVGRGANHNFLTHPFDPKLANADLEKVGAIGQIRYSDGCLAQLGLIEERSCFLRCYDWKTKQEQEIHMIWSFSVAFAVNERLYDDPADGILGLGLNGYQSAYMFRSNRVRPPNFLNVITPKLKQDAHARPGKQKTAIYFTLRLPPEYYLEGLPGGIPIQSWMSFNSWPCSKEPAWNTGIIPVCDGATTNYKEWAVYLRYIALVPISGARRPDLETNRIYSNTDMNFVDERRPHGLRVILDTGASVTKLPQTFVEKINHFFGSKNIISANQGSLVTYAVPRWVHEQEQKIQVLYEFGGEGGKVVRVHGPVIRFFYQHHVPQDEEPFEGLVFPQHPSRDHGVFGLNFFQSMYVSVHQSFRGAHFVRMAPQWPENDEQDLRDYRVDFA